VLDDIIVRFDTNGPFPPPPPPGAGAETGQSGTKKSITIKGVEISLYKNENERTQDFVMRTLHLLFNNNFIPANEIKNMLDKDYCKETFALGWSIIQDDKEKIYDKAGRPKYWTPEKFGGRYYACSQWWKDKDSIYKEKLSQWIVKLGKQQ
jgi:hypothetical protein